MTRSLLIAGAAALALFAGTPAGFAQSDPAALQLIERLRPQPGGQTRGIRVPGAPGIPPADSAPVQPAPVFGQPPATQPPAAVAGPGTPVITAPGTARPPQAIARQPMRETTSELPSASITVTFPSGSWAISPAAERALAPLGRALTSPDLAGFRFRIEGHTDTVGSAEFNQILSERRAAAVRDHLISRYGVEPHRLTAVGFGQTQLLVPTPDNTPNADNRRVQVVNIGG